MVALILKEICKVVDASKSVPMLCPKSFFLARQRAAIEHLGFVDVAYVTEKSSQIIDAR